RIGIQPADYLICRNGMPGDGFGTEASAQRLAHYVPSRASSRRLCDKLHALERGQIVVGIVHYPVRQLRILLRPLFVGNETQQVPDAIEARAPLIVRANDIPWREVRVRGGEHRIARPRILEPFAA